MSGPVKSIEVPGLKAEGDLLYSMRQEVARLLDRKSLGFPGAQPVSFARRHLEELTRQDYFVCEKSDGMRYLLYLTKDEHGEEIHYLIDRRNDYWYIPKGALHFPVPRDVQGFHTDTLIDGELVMDKLKNGDIQPKYLVFDCMVLDGNSLMNRTLDKRIAYFKERIFDPYSSLLKEYPEEIAYMHFIVELKSMQVSYGIEMMFRQILPNLPHGNDGLIFTCRMTDYKHGTDQNILKWKPENENSVDFRLCLDFPLVQPDPQDITEGITKPYLDYDAIPVCNLHAYAGDGQEDPWFASLHLEPKEWEDLKALSQPLNDRIIECYMDSSKRWRFMRFRDDKQTANHISTVESVIESITDRVTEKDLLAAAKGIRDAWKLRESKARANSGSGTGAKRKAEEQGNGRPSPGPLNR
ncbi:mRNA capping enzyme alpha [Phlyctema vagabunda]|uniref:mRNA-capping enzyme subunit alpha n=1 Tax=Phlyctema vagabunda TaxID=108571 RepID=A0ABR4P7T1_9HELO